MESIFKILVALSPATIALVLWIYLSLRLHTQKSASIPWRGIIKFATLDKLPSTARKLYTLWFKALMVLSGLTIITVIYFTWNTDHSFLFFIFPLFFYYFFLRYFFWEKSDILD